MLKQRTPFFILFSSVWILWNYDKVRSEDSTGTGALSNDLPRFITKGGVYRAVIGDTVVLPCQVENSGRYVLLWKRGNAVLSAGDMKITVEPRIHLVEGSNLEIRKLRIHDAGDYICQMSTLTPQDQIHTLEILVPPSIRSEPNNDEVVITKGDTVSLQCRANGNPSPSIRWTRKNNVLPNGEQSVEGNIFGIQNAGRHHAGIYICSASNGVGTPVSTSIQVKVQYPPEIEVERSWIHSGEGYEAELACIVHSDPPSSMKWYRETMILDTTDRRLVEERGNRHALVIRKVEASDFGNYTCEADNKLGRAKNYMELSGRPNRVVFRSDPKGRSRDSFNLTWHVESFSPVSEYRLLYRKAHVNNSRYIQQGEWNDVIVPITDYIYNPSISVSVPRAVASLASPASASIVHVKSYHIRHLEPEAVYEAQVLARNKYGVSPPSDLFIFTTRRTDLNPFESSPHHDVLADPEMRDLGITSASSGTKAIHPLLSTFVHVFANLGFVLSTFLVLKLQIVS